MIGLHIVMEVLAGHVRGVVAFIGAALEIARDIALGIFAVLAVLFFFSPEIFLIIACVAG